MMTLYATYSNESLITSLSQISLVQNTQAALRSAGSCCVFA